MQKLGHGFEGKPCPQQCLPFLIARVCLSSSHPWCATREVKLTTRCSRSGLIRLRRVASRANPQNQTHQTLAMKRATKGTRRAQLTVGFERMRFWERLRLLFASRYPAQTGVSESDRPKATPKQGLGVVKLNAASKVVLSKALRALEPGQKGWISFDDAARLFSPSAGPPSEWGQDSIRGLNEFAAEIEHRSSPERNEGDERVYFTRIRSLIF